MPHPGGDRKPFFHQQLSARWRDPPRRPAPFDRLHPRSVIPKAWTGSHPNPKALGVKSEVSGRNDSGKSDEGLMGPFGEKAGLHRRTGMANHPNSLRNRGLKRRTILTGREWLAVGMHTDGRNKDRTFRPTYKLEAPASEFPGLAPIRSLKLRACIRAAVARRIVCNPTASRCSSWGRDGELGRSASYPYCGGSAASSGRPGRDGGLLDESAADQATRQKNARTDPIHPSETRGRAGDTPPFDGRATRGKAREQTQTRAGEPSGPDRPFAPGRARKGARTDPIRPRRVGAAGVGSGREEIA